MGLLRSDPPLRTVWALPSSTLVGRGRGPVQSQHASCLALVIWCKHTAANRSLRRSRPCCVTCSKRDVTLNYLPFARWVDDVAGVRRLAANVEEEW